MKIKLFLIMFLAYSSIFGGYRIIAPSVACAGNPCDIPPDHCNCNYAYDATLDRINGDDPNVPAVFNVWVQGNRFCGMGCADNILKYSYLTNQYNFMDSFECNGDFTSLCPGRQNSTPPTNLDTFAGPKFLRDSQGHEFLFFSHGSADTYNGNIQFKYRAGGIGTWSENKDLFTISAKNISNCDCRGGFARVAAVEVGNYIYFYLEIWQVVKNVNGEWVPDNTDKCLEYGEPGKKIGAAGIFLARVKKSSTEPFLDLSDGGAQIYVKRYNAWINMETEKIQPAPTGTESGFPKPIPTWYIVGWGPNYKYPNQSLDFGFYDIAVLNTYGLGDVIINQNGTFILTSSVSSLNLALAFESSDETGTDFIPQSGEMIQCFLTSDNPNDQGCQVWAGLTESQRGYTQPSFYKGGINSFNLPWYYIAYNVLDELDNVPVWGLAYVRIGKVEKFLPPLPGPPRKIPRFLSISNLNYYGYFDLDQNDRVDLDIYVSKNFMQEVSYEKLFVHGYQEEGASILVLAVGCHQKKNGKVVCSSEDTEIPGLIVDMENRVIYLQNDYFDSGDTVDLQIILRSWAKEKEDKDKIKKPKKCKNEDKCVMAKIKIVN